MKIVVELVVKDIQKSSEFYTKYFGFKIDFTEYEPVSWMQLSNDNTILMLVTYDYAKEDIPGFKEYSVSTNIYKFCYNSLDEIKKINDNLKKDKKEVFLDLRKADFRYEFGVYDEDKNMILVTKFTED